MRYVELLRVIRDIPAALARIAEDEVADKRARQPMARLLP